MPTQATEPVDTDKEDKGSNGGSTTVMIILTVLIVVAVGTFGTIIFLQQKKLKEN